MYGLRLCGLPPQFVFKATVNRKSDWRRPGRTLPLSITGKNVLNGEVIRFSDNSQSYCAIPLEDFLLLLFLKAPPPTLPFLG